MTQRYSREDIARRAAADIPPGSYVNLGIGLPVMALDYWKPEHGVTVHSENGILGMRARSDADPVDPDLTNAAKQNVALSEGGSFFNHADSFAMMRGGHLDYCILGAYQVSETGDLANWSLGQAGVAAARVASRYGARSACAEAALPGRTSVTLPARSTISLAVTSTTGGQAASCAAGYTGVTRWMVVAPLDTSPMASW